MTIPLLVPRVGAAVAVEEPEAVVTVVVSASATAQRKSTTNMKNVLCQRCTWHDAFKRTAAIVTRAFGLCCDQMRLTDGV